VRLLLVHGLGRLRDFWLGEVTAEILWECKRAAAAHLVYDSTIFRTTADSFSVPEIQHPSIVSRVEEF
jgi:hypothetical protein